MLIMLIVDTLKSKKKKEEIKVLVACSALLIFGLSALYRGTGLQLPAAASITLIYSIITATTIFVAWLSYKFFESPFLRMKNKFAIIHSQNSMGK